MRLPCTSRNQADAPTSSNRYCYVFFVVLPTEERFSSYATIPRTGNWAQVFDGAAPIVPMKESDDACNQTVLRDRPTVCRSGAHGVWGRRWGKYQRRSDPRCPAKCGPTSEPG